MWLQGATICCVLLSSLLRDCQSQGTAVITLSNHQVFVGEPVILTCSYGDQRLLVAATFDAFVGSRKIGSLSCSQASNNIGRSGIFSGTVLSPGCLDGIRGSTNVSVEIAVSSSLELDLNCTANVINNDWKLYTMESRKTSFIINDIRVTPNPAIFNDSDNAIVKCEPLRDWHTLILKLTIISSNGSEITRSGIGSALTMLPLPLVNWHNAVVTCLVSNRNSTNISTTSVIFINQINCISENQHSWKEAANGSVNCSAYVSGYPIHNFSWSFSTEVTDENSFFHYGPIFNMNKNGIFESFSCTVTNGIINKSAVVLFRVNTSRGLTTTENNYWFATTCFLTTLLTDKRLSTQILNSTSSVGINYWVLCSAVAGSLIVLGLVITIAHKRRSLSRDDEIEMTDNHLYEHLQVNSTGLIQSEVKNGNPVFYRLLIAEKGTMTALSTLTLPTTVTMEYSTSYEAADKILETLDQELALHNNLKFKSVALFLPNVQQELHVAKDLTMDSRKRIVLNDVHILEIFSSIAELCFGMQTEGHGIDIFNYCGTDAASLACTLTDAAKVPVTVTCGYGFGETKDLKKLHGSLAAKYFNFSRLATTSLNPIWHCVPFNESCNEQ